jgi:quercetin 2,3-dioxygenase
MPPVRAIAATSRSVPTIEGAGVHLRRAFGFATPERFDPFLLLDDFRSDTPADYAPGFPWHPHRGIETITYLLKGRVAHGDSLGNLGTIAPGEVQWMTAGSGIVHQEMPQGDERGAMHGFQLWLNLPAAEKMSQPRYRGISAASIPRLELPGGGSIAIICGRAGGLQGPVTGISTDPTYLDITLPPLGRLRHPAPAGTTAFAYVIAGAARFAPGAKEESPDTTLVLFGEGEEIEVTGGAAGARFLFFAGRPLAEPIAWQGPIVMNSQEQLRQAFAEYRNGTFLKHPQPAGI